jgi:hypothetical protein
MAVMPSARGSGIEWKLEILQRCSGLDFFFVTSLLGDAKKAFVEETCADFRK